mmetsp:Transcript_254/g.829  ORF Transcript_254/g.829 Transcript_254/m.829 type:complete len:123 (+) Transcript_254:80-448(+)
MLPCSVSALWTRVGAVSGAAAVGAAAYGAHGLSPEDESLVEVYKTGNSFHLLHSAVLTLAPALPTASKRPALSHASMLLFAGGTAVFSGSCYMSALTEDRKNGRLAPIGGSALILAWLSLAL